MCNQIITYSKFQLLTSNPSYYGIQHQDRKDFLFNRNFLRWIDTPEYHSTFSCVIVCVCTERAYLWVYIIQVLVSLRGRRVFGCQVVVGLVLHNPAVHGVHKVPQPATVTWHRVAVLPSVGSGDSNLCPCFKKVGFYGKIR